MNREKIETATLPERCAVISMADSPDQVAAIRDEQKVAARLTLIFNDASESFQQVRSPTLDDAHKILAFVREHKDLPSLVIQCQIGIGRSMAVQAAMVKINGDDPAPILKHGTYNRRLYKLLLEAAGIPLEPEPLVSMNVRVKYGPERLEMFLLSMQRQRYEHWEVVAVTDGPNPDAARVVEELNDSRIRLIQTEKPLGRWGHPYRQLGLDQCRGEFIGMSNDDNYYAPGYLEQMVQALADADLATCPAIHNYVAWGLVEPGADLGSWIARASLVHQVPWPGTEFRCDKDFIAALKALAGSRVAVVERLLFVHN